MTTSTLIAKPAGTATRFTLRSFDWAGVGMAFIAGFVLLMATAVPQQMARQWGWFGDYWYEGAGAISRLAVAALGVVFLRYKGWLRLSGITSDRPVRSGFRGSWLLPMAALLPAIGLFTTSFASTGTIVSWLAYVGGTVLYEAVVFRGIIFSFLVTRWGSHHDGVRWAAVVSALLFGLAHVAPIAIVMASITGLALMRLQLDVRHIVPGLVLHFVYDSLSLFPLDAAGEPLPGIGGIGTAIAAPVTLVAAGLAFRALGSHSWGE